jgi:hypothetical protein
MPHPTQYTIVSVANLGREYLPASRVKGKVGFPEVANSSEAGLSKAKTFSRLLLELSACNWLRLIPVLFR